MAIDLAPQSPLICFGAKSDPLNVGDGQSIERVKISGEWYKSPNFAFGGWGWGNRAQNATFSVEFQLKTYRPMKRWMDLSLIFHIHETFREPQAYFL